MLTTLNLLVLRLSNVASHLASRCRISTDSTELVSLFVLGVVVRTESLTVLYREEITGDAVFKIIYAGKSKN